MVDGRTRRGVSLSVSPAVVSVGVSASPVAVTSVTLPAEHRPHVFAIATG